MFSYHQQGVIVLHGLPYLSLERIQLVLDVTEGRGGDILVHGLVEVLMGHEEEEDSLSAVSGMGERRLLTITPFLSKKNIVWKWF